ncbi:MAG TPA: hypothetical protein VGP07_12610 [Polyangia bacterium]|jgi:hypothetical protein
MNHRRAASLASLIAAGSIGLLTSMAVAQEEAAAPPPASTAASRSSLFAISSGPFGEANQMAFSMSSEGEFPFSFSKTSGSAWSLRLRPSLDYFIQSNVSVGGIVALTKDGGGSSIGVGARAGYNAVLGSLVSVWIRGGLDLTRISVNNGPSTTVTSLDINAPFLFHFAPHFLLGVGPFFSLPLTNSAAMGAKDPTFGLTALVGGYF